MYCETHYNEYNIPLYSTSNEYRNWKQRYEKIQLGKCIAWSYPETVSIDMLCSPFTPTPTHRYTHTLSHTAKNLSPSGPCSDALQHDTLSHSLILHTPSLSTPLPHCQYIKEKKRVRASPVAHFSSSADTFGLLQQQQPQQQQVCDHKNNKIWNQQREQRCRCQQRCWRRRCDVSVARWNKSTSAQETIESAPHKQQQQEHNNNRITHHVVYIKVCFSI